MWRCQWTWGYSFKSLVVSRRFEGVGRFAEGEEAALDVPIAGYGAWLVQMLAIVNYFFFQAEDGIRDLTVTGVQTCALPISPGLARMNYLQPERLDRLAREYALGTLAGPARRRFERLLRNTPAAMRAVGAWQERLGGLAGAVPPMQPSDSVWRRLEERLFPSARVVPRGP